MLVRKLLGLQAEVESASVSQPGPKKQQPAPADVKPVTCLKLFQSL